MSAKPFIGSPFTKVNVGGDQVIVAHEHEVILNAVGTVGLNGHSFVVGLPVLVRIAEGRWTIDTGSIRLDLVTSAVTYFPDLDGAEVFDLINAAQESNPDAFTVLERLVRDFHAGAF